MTTAEPTAAERHAEEMRRVREERRRAQRYVASNCIDADDCRYLLEMIGLEEL